MIRFAWVQARTQTAVAAAGLAALAVLLAVTGPHLLHLYDTTVANCHAAGNCAEASALFGRNYHVLQELLDIFVVVLPAVIGIFWGAPLVARELETGTHRLAWTQSVTRGRWLVVRLGVTGLASMAAAALLSLMVTWWSSPVDRVSLNQYVSFDYRGIVGVGYAAFAFALGVTAGVLIRRTLPAMAVSLAAFVFARLAVIQWIRPHLTGAAHRALPLNPLSTGYGTQGIGLFGGSHVDTLQPSPPDIPGAWILSTQVVDKSGHGLSAQLVARACPQLGKAPSGAGAHARGPVPAAVQYVLQNCVARIGTTYHEVVTYQPASHYWPIQWYELAIFLGAAVILCGLSLWWVRRRLA